MTMEKAYIGSAIQTGCDVCEHAVDGYYVGSMCELSEEEVLAEQHKKTRCKNCPLCKGGNENQEH